MGSLSSSQNLIVIYVDKCLQETGDDTCQTRSQKKSLMTETGEKAQENKAQCIAFF